MKMTRRFFPQLLIGMLATCEIKPAIAGALKPAASCKLLLPACNQIDILDSQISLSDFLMLWQIYLIS
jgi:hypothetical protein